MLDILENCFEWNRDRKHTENKERGGGLRALDGNEGGRNAACQEAAKINLIYIILCNIQS